LDDLTFSKKVKETLHGTPLLQCTQITNHVSIEISIQRGKRINETMSFQPKSFKVPNQVVHSIIITCTHSTSDLQQIKSYQVSIEQSNQRTKDIDPEAKDIDLMSKSTHTHFMHAQPSIKEPTV
jgi:hypothetical protein